MKLALVAIVLCAAICVASATKVLASSSRQLTRREMGHFKRIFKRQAYSGEFCLEESEEKIFDFILQIPIAIVDRVLYPIVARIS